MFCHFLQAAGTHPLRRCRSLSVVDSRRGWACNAVCDRSLRRDLKTLARFLEVYCRCRHGAQPKRAVRISGINVAAIAGKRIDLCPDCAKLLTHAFVKRSHCPMNPKPACKHCPNHCYHPAYRRKMQEVMRFSGKRLLITGRLDYIFHMLF